MSKQVEICEALQKELQAGVYPEKSRFPSEGELADRFGVSTITVNKAVGLLIQKGYLARSGSRRGGTVVKSCRIFPKALIGIVNDFQSTFHSRIVTGAMNAAWNAGYGLFPLPYDPKSMEMWTRQLNAEIIAGILTVSSTRLTVPLPVIYIDKTNFDHFPELCQVRCDSYSGGRKIAELLLREGHREIVYYCSGQEAIEDVSRRRGFIDRLGEAGVPDPESRIFSASSGSLHCLCRALEEELRRFPGLTALACETDPYAFDMLRAGRKLGIDVGGKIRLTGFGNVREIQALFPFPTIEQHPEETGYRACLRLLELMEKPEAPPFVEELPVELIVP